MSLATQIAGAIECAQFYQLNDLSRDLWKAHAVGHLDDDQAQQLAEKIEAKKPKGPAAWTGFQPVTAPKPKPQRSPDRQVSIERRRRLARASPVPPELVDQFTTSEHAVMTVVCGEVQRCGLCAWFVGKIAAIAGCCRTTVRNTLRKARKLGLLLTHERRRAGQKSLTNIVRVLRQTWGRWLRGIGYKKLRTTTDNDSKHGAAHTGDSFGDGFSWRAGVG